MSESDKKPSLIKRLLGEGGPDREKIAREAEEATRQYEEAYGVSVPEEAGIEEANPVPSVEDEGGGTEEFLNPETGKPEQYPMLRGMAPAMGGLRKLKAKGAPKSLQVDTSAGAKMNKAVKALQQERQLLDLNTPQGRSRLKEIDSLLSNRTYFSE